MPRLNFSSSSCHSHSHSSIPFIHTPLPALLRLLTPRLPPPPPPLRLIQLRSFTKITFDHNNHIMDTDNSQQHNDGQVKIHSRPTTTQQQQQPQEPQQQQKTLAELEKEKWQDAHRLACEGNRKKYIDPKTGYSVMTELLHKRRGYCCGNACRHCPYNNENVGVSPEVKRANIARGKQQRKEIEAIEGKPVWADEDDNDYSD